MRYFSILFLLAQVPCFAQTIQAPYIHQDGSIVDEIAVSVGQTVIARVGIEPDTPVTFRVEPPVEGMTITPLSDTAAELEWRPLEAGHVSVTLNAYDGDQHLDEVTWTYQVGPFNIRELVAGSTTNVNIQEHYNRINLMVFLIGDMPFGVLYNSPLQQAIPLLSNRLSEAQELYLLQIEVRDAMQKAMMRALEILNGEYDGAPHPLKNSTIRDHFENDYLHDERESVQALYSEFKNLGAAGFDIPFIHGLKRDSFDIDGFTPNMGDFLDKFLAEDQWGDLTELDRYLTSRADHPGKDFLLLEEAIRRGVILQSKDDIAITPVRGNRCETKDNSKICAKFFNGSNYEDTCLDCTNPFRQSFCSLSSPGVCSLASDPGPCSSYPPV